MILDLRRDLMLRQFLDKSFKSSIFGRKSPTPDDEDMFHDFPQFKILQSILLYHFLVCLYNTKRTGRAAATLVLFFL